MRGTSDALSLIGRILLAAIFVWSGFGKIGGFEGLAGQIASKGFPAAQAFAAATIAIEIGAGLMLVAGWKARWAALLLAVFTVIVTIFFHNYWAVPEAQKMMQQIQLHEESGVDRRPADGDCIWSGTLQRRQALGKNSLQKRRDIADLLFADRVRHRVFMPLDLMAGCDQRIA